MARPAGRKGRVDRGRAASGVCPEASRHEPDRWSLELLEPRLLLSALPIQGTAGDDTITVSQDLTGVTVVTQLRTDFYAGSFESIAVDGLAGNDIIRLMHSVFADHSVYGGDGSDTIFDAAAGAGQIDGGEGDDLLVTVGGGQDMLVGGAGSDSFWCDGADTISDADYAESFRSVHTIQEFYQPYTTDPQSPDYVSLEIDGQNLRDPTASSDYESFARMSLFVDGRQYDDAVQGSVGDCYLISAVASLADAVPEVIEQTIAPLGDGTYAVRFYHDFSEYYIRVDADLPASGSTPTYAKLGADGELWVPLIEKAYAYFRYGQNSYISLDGGFPSEVYEVIAASDYASIWTGWSEATIADFISTHLTAGHAISAPSMPNAQSPIAVNHSYMVKSMRMAESITYIMLYNPWGSLLEITLSQLKSNFGMVTASLADDNRFPVAVDDSAVTEVNSPVTINVIANDSDPESDPLSLKSVGWPSHGTRVNNGDGTITYTPSAGFVGTDTFTYVLRDGNGGLAQGTVTVRVNGDAPQVSEVLVSSSSWSQAFLDALGGVGFAIPAGPSQLDALPWNNINRISMVFSEDVNVSQDDLRVYGLNVSQYAITAFDYDSGTCTATWTLGKNIDSDLLQVVLSDAVVDLVGHRLDGEWTDATSTYPSGDGSAGGEFQMRINVLPGDADGDGTVGFGDLVALFGSNAVGSTADFNGNGAVDAADYIMLKRSFGRSLPQLPDDFGNDTGSAAAMVMAASGSLIVVATINYGWDVDVFKFNATVTGDMTVLMAKDGVSDLIGAVRALDVAGTQLAADDASDGTAQIAFDVVAGQTYYLSASSVSHTAGGYVLTVATQADPTPDPPPDPPTPGASVDGTVQQSGGTTRLVIAGTDGNDVITLSYNGSATSLASGAGTQTFAGYYWYISVYGFGGDDVIRLDYSIIGSTLVYAGDGNDKVYENSQGFATIYGGAGDDLLISVGGGNDIVYGEAGTNSYWADTTDNLADSTSAEASAKTVHLIAGFYQPYSTNPVSADYVSKDINSQSLRDPTSGAAYSNYANQPLFVDGPQYDDIRQGALGDCYYLATLSALSDTDPNLIRQAMTELGDGTYAVRFYRGGSEEYLRLDADMPSAYAALTPDGETWVMLMEKAYAFFRQGRNSYSSINSGGPAIVFRELTGESTQGIMTSEMAAETLASYINTNLVVCGHPVTLVSRSNPASPIVGDHVYMVKSIEGAGDEAYVTVYNPWGFDGCSYDSNPNDGLLRLSIAKIQECFSIVTVALV